MAGDPTPHAAPNWWLEETPVDIDDVEIEHAARMWESATDNANRIASRIQLISGGIIGILTVGMLSFSWLYEVPSIPMVSRFWTIAIHTLITGSVFWMMTALFRLYYKPVKGREPAADLMEFRPADDEKPMRSRIFHCTYRAYLDLKERNARERRRLNSAEKFTVAKPNSSRQAAQGDVLREAERETVAANERIKALSDRQKDSVLQRIGKLVFRGA